MRKPYIIYHRAASGKDKSYQVGLLDPSTGTYSRRVSLRDQWGLPVRSRTLAEDLARKMLGTLPMRGDMPLADYLRGFWRADGAYARARAAAGHPLSSEYLANNRSAIKLHILPYFERACPGLFLSRVTPAHIEALIMGLHGGGTLTAQTVNLVRKSMSVALGEAERLGRITANPVDKVTRLAERRSAREILNPAEVRKFFALEWGDPRLRAINLLAATTGLRLGECLGLQHGDIRDGWIHVCHNWQRAERLKAPKWGSIRDVPIPNATETALRSLIMANPWGNAFVFWGSSEDFPVSKRTVEVAYNAALASVGIPEEERKRRGLTFHAWRHFFNAMLRGRIADHALRALTGHRSETMTERYSHVTEEQRREVKRLAEELV
jgi:integrase